MPKFGYVAYARDGRRTEGTLEAASSDAVAAELRARGLAAGQIRLDRSLGPRAEAEGGGLGLSALRERLDARLRLRARSVAVLIRALAVTQANGVPLYDALTLLNEEMAKGRVGRIVAAVREDIAEGATLSEAMRKHEAVIGSVPCAMIEAGEAAGHIDEALDRVADMLETRFSLQRRFYTAALQPVLTAAFAVAVFFVLVIWVMPTFETLYDGFDADLPSATRNALAFGRWMARFYYIFLIAAALIVAGCLRVMRRDNARLHRDRALLRLPLFGPLVRDGALVRISSVLSAAAGVGMPLTKSLSLASQAAGNLAFAQALDRARDAVADGSTLHEALAAEPLFPALFAQAVRIGESTGTLGDALLGYVNSLREITESSADRRVISFGVGIVIAVGAVVATLLILLYLPVFRLADLA